MEALTTAEARVWCADRGIRIGDRGLPLPTFEDSEGRDFKIPVDAGARIALLHELFQDVPIDQDALLWFDDWGVWPSSQRWHMFERFRASYGEHRSLSEAPAFVFTPAERDDLISFAGFAILFLSDCHVLTATGDSWLFLSHDEVGWFCTRPRVEARTQHGPAGDRQGRSR